MKFVIWNALTDNPNLGCQALGLSLVAGIQREFPDAELWVSASTSTVRSRTFELEDGESLRFMEFGASLSRNPFKPGNFGRDNLMLRLLGPFANSRLIGLLRSSDLVIDVSGGDSFTTLYGTYRYEYNAIPKLMTLRLNRPLVLAPQTYGPFSDRYQTDAGDIIRKARMAWGRDEEAADYLESVGVEPRWCPDVAFTLPARGLTNSMSVDRPVIGCNVSGLIWSLDRTRLAETFGIRLDYKALKETVVRELLDRFPGHRVMLIPHVQSEVTTKESDTFACESLCSRFEGDRVFVADRFMDAMDAKSAISRCSLMLGTRMHACVAGLSSAVPTIGFAYSLKTQPVFKTVGMESFVVDLRAENEESAMGKFRGMLDEVDAIRTPLRDACMRTRERSNEFFKSLHDVVGVKSAVTDVALASSQ